MEIDWKQPKYIAPLLLLPFLCLFFYVYRSSTAKKVPVQQQSGGINATVADVSGDVKKQDLADKLDAYRNTYKEADGNTAVIPIPREQSDSAVSGHHYRQKEKIKLDSIDKAMKARFGLAADRRHTAENSASDPGDRAMAAALQGIAQRRQYSLEEDRKNREDNKEKDPMVLFRQQMAYIDSMGKATDHALSAEKVKADVALLSERKAREQPHLQVHKDAGRSAGFNSVFPEQHDDPIKAIIDEEITGYAGSRVRIRLLDDIVAGNTLIRKGTYLYALINGFSGQRVNLVVTSVRAGSRVLPVKLEVYDLDGMPGLYVPESAFRDFTKDLGVNSMQGVTLDGSSGSGSQFLMSSASKVFQSTSSAIAEAIRKNKAKLKYNSSLYLIDDEALKNSVKN